MFYVLSKALLFLIQPATWLVLLVAYALWTKRRKNKRRAILAILSLYLILGNPMIYNYVLSQLEWPSRGMEGEHYRYAIVLGGHGEYNTHRDGLELNKAADRLVAAINVYHQGLVDQIIISSGVSPLDRPELNEAAISKQMLVAANIPAEDIIVEDASWNTHENALYTTELIKSRGGDQSSILVTSAFHMNRALQCFRKEGLDPSPYPVDYISGGGVCLGLGCVLPSVRVLLDWQVIIKEKVGLLVYGVKGYV